MTRRRRRGSAVRPWLIALLCVAGLFAAGWALVSEIGRGPGPVATPTQPAPVVSSQLADTGAGPAVIQACEDSVARGEAAVARAHTAVGDWTAHVQAMVDWESGKNTEARTKQIWKRTRARGATDVAGFRAASTDYKQARDGCLHMPAEEVPREAATNVARCRDVSRQTDAVLVAAGPAVADWAAHLKAMADREAGRLDPHHAWATWLKAYKTARVNIDKFGAAERVYQDHASCGPAG